MKKLVHISMVASPHWVRFIPHLRKYFDAEFYFYEHLGQRQSWWKMDLGEHGHILPCWFKWHSKYMTFSVISILQRERPDILMLGGFGVPANYIAYLWARLHGVPVLVFTERSRVISTGKLRKYSIVWRLIRFLYRNVSRVMPVSADSVPQFRDTFRFGDKVVAGRYPTDLDRYYSHPVRTRKDAYTLIFPNRMTDIYNPIGAVEIFAEVLKRYPKTRLKINATGELRSQVEQRIAELNIGDSVEFLDGLKSWDDLSDVYASCEIMFFPAKYSNGNYTIQECRVSGMGIVISDRILGHSASDVKEAGCGFIVPLKKEIFVEKICWYIEHPEVFAREAYVNREQLRYLTHEETARFYYEIMNDMRCEV